MELPAKAAVAIAKLAASAAARMEESNKGSTRLAPKAVIVVCLCAADATQPARKERNLSVVVNWKVWKVAGWLSIEQFKGD